MTPSGESEQLHSPAVCKVVFKSVVKVLLGYLLMVVFLKQFCNFLFGKQIYDSTTQSS